jgi:3-isopropylmalate/(R)-2-methylmalate dehydratase small subunit
LALECDGISTAFEEGDEAKVSFEDFTVNNSRTGDILQSRLVPDILFNTMKAGGVLPLLEAEGLIAVAE